MNPCSMDRRPLYDVVGMRSGGHDLHVWVVLAKSLTRAHQGAASTQTGYEHVHVRQVTHYLRPRGLVVRHRVGFAGVLVRHEPRGVFKGDLLCHEYRLVCPLVGVGVDDFSAVRLEDPHPFRSHARRHDHFDVVAFDATDHRQSDPGVSTGRLEDRGARLEPALGLGVLDHGTGDAVFDRAGRVMTFELGEDPDLLVRAQAGHLHQRRIANGVDDVPFVCAGACVSDGQFCCRLQAGRGPGPVDFGGMKRPRAL